MKNMSLIEVTEACNGVYVGVDSLKNSTVTGVTIDSRKVEKDYLFIPIKGARVDGHDYISHVIESGALCTLSEKNLGAVTHPYILVDSCEQALKDIAEHYRISLGIPVVGITGSVGKTSTKEMIASVLSQKFNVLKTAGNFNNEIGVPLTIFNLREEHDVAVLEMGINHFGEMTRLSKIARPTIAVITNIGQCHLEFLNDRDGVLKAKTEIFEYLQPNGSVILNGDDDKLATIYSVDENVPHFFGLNPVTDFPSIYADNIINLGLEGTTCSIHLTDERIFSCTIAIPGAHMVLNALAGASVGMELGLSDDEIKNGIEALVPVAGRNNLIKTDMLTIIDDCYNANPVSMKASLDVLSTATTRKVAILGDMGELGINEIAMHEDVGRHAVLSGIDVICCIGSLSQHIADSASASISTLNSNTLVMHYDTIDEFLSTITDVISIGDSVLVKASHFMGFPEIVAALRNINI
ncbi:MAG: UDP-N-acetylmuramoyl-tripeptide--D-alanyl-D-alanine ligase [Eubacteriales bacterium]